MQATKEAVLEKPAGGNGALLREIWLRHADPCEVDAYLAAGRCYEHLFPPYTPEKNTELKLWFEY